MADQVLRGSCLCKAVRYEVWPPFMNPDQFRWISGEELISRYDLPEARSFATAICRGCNCPVPRPSRDRERVIVPAGTLDEEPPGKPTAHRQWGSRVGWVAIDESHLPCEE
jgi:hypothetical protein